VLNDKIQPKAGRSKLGALRLWYYWVIFDFTGNLRQEY